MPRKKRKRKKPSLPDVEDVLAGRMKPDAGTLIDMISKINPTGLDLPKREAEQRYAHKSTLQSLLIRICADDITVEPVEDKDSTVSLHHRSLNRPACHAIIEDLDEEARSWVRMQLDLQQWADEHGEDRAEEDADDLPGPEHESNASEPSPPPPGALLKGSPAELVRRGQAALEEYDFEGARACLEAAFSKSDGDRDPARGLLTLLVDHLGVFDKALTLAPRLSRHARKDGQVRLLMALAAARAKKFNDALSWVEGLTGERAAEVDLALIDHAIESGELKEARQRLEGARRRGAHEIDVHAREVKIEALMADERRPHEEALEKLLEQDRRQEAMDLARKILKRWPGSPPAKALVREDKQEKRAQRARERPGRFGGGQVRMLEDGPGHAQINEESPSTMAAPQRKKGSPGFNAAVSGNIQVGEKTVIADRAHEPVSVLRICAERLAPGAAVRAAAGKAIIRKAEPVVMVRREAVGTFGIIAAGIVAALPLAPPLRAHQHGGRYAFKGHQRPGVRLCRRQLVRSDVEVLQGHDRHIVAGARGKLRDVRIFDVLCVVSYTVAGGIDQQEQDQRGEQPGRPRRMREL